VCKYVPSYAILTAVSALLTTGRMAFHLRLTTLTYVTVRVSHTKTDQVSNHLLIDLQCNLLTQDSNEVISCHTKSGLSGASRSCKTIDIPYDGPNYLQSVYDTIVIAIWSVVVGFCTRSPVPSWKADQSETVGSCML